MLLRTVAFAILAIIAATLSAGACAQVGKEVRRWPFSPLSAEERRARIQFLVQRHTFRSDMADKRCSKILNSVKSGAYEVMIPTYIGDASSSEIFSIIKQCPSINVNRVWFSDEFGPIDTTYDPDFGEMTLSERDQYSDFYYEYSEDIEVYDLSGFFSGRNVMATFAEPGVVRCKNSEHPICANLRGYREFSGVIVSAVIDVSSCTKLIGPKSPAQSRLRTNTLRYDEYEEIPNTYAFLSIKGLPYRFAMNVQYGWSDFSKLVNGMGSVSIIAESITEEDNHTCKFSTTNK